MRRAQNSAAGRAWLVAVVLLVVVGGGAGYWLPVARNRSRSSSRARSRRPSAAARGRSRAQCFGLRRRASTGDGVLESHRQSREVLIEEGMAVKEGQLLARLDDTTTAAELALAQRQLDAARKI